MRTEVTIVRPTRTVAEALGNVLGYLLRPFVSGFVVMILVGAAFPEVGLSYWQSVVLAAVVQILMSNTDYLEWTKAGNIVK